MNTPLYSYLSSKNIIKENDVRALLYQNRIGYNTTSIYKKMLIDRHNINQDKGSFTLWVLPLEDLSTVSHQEHIMDRDPLYQNYSIISDYEYAKDYSKATFALHWASNWYPQLFAKCFEGYIYSDSPTNKPYLNNNPIKSAFAIDVVGSKAFSAAGRFSFSQAHWYQLGVCWDKEKNVFSIYVNGVLVSAANSGVKMTWETANSILYVGNPTFALSDLNFYNDCLPEAEFQALFYQDATYVDKDLQKQLRGTYLGEGLEYMNFEPGEDWKCKLNLSLTDEKDMKEFYVQGCVKSPIITSEGLLIKTNTVDEKMYEEDGEIIDRNNMYLWSKNSFEGDLYVELEFMPKKHNGFSMLIFQASGMQREDFMKDYRLRNTGTMSMVLWEDVRSYNWGFFREMDDIRDDVASHIIMKNPWLRPMSYQCRRERMQIDRWYKLQFIQRGNHILGLVDGYVIFDFYDDGFNNSGPIYSCGHFGIRCMKRTEMLYRNLKICNKPTFFQVMNA